MERVIDYVKIVFATIGTVVSYLIGNWDTGLIVLVSFMALDYFTGVLSAYILKEISSNVGLKGIARKALIFIVLIISVLLDRLLNADVYIFRTLVCYFYIANEGISILENCIKIGIPIPSSLQEVLIQLREEKK